MRPCAVSRRLKDAAITFCNARMSSAMSTAATPVNIVCENFGYPVERRWQCAASTTAARLRHGIFRDLHKAPLEIGRAICVRTKYLWGFPHLHSSHHNNKTPFS